MAKKAKSKTKKSKSKTKKGKKAKKAAPASKKKKVAAKKSAPKKAKAKSKAEEEVRAEARSGPGPAPAYTPPPRWAATTRPRAAARTAVPRKRTQRARPVFRAVPIRKERKPLWARAFASFGHPDGESPDRESPHCKSRASDPRLRPRAKHSPLPLHLIRAALGCRGSGSRGCAQAAPPSVRCHVGSVSCRFRPTSVPVRWSAAAIRIA